MEALDANVILRYLVGDNPEQETAARALLDGLTPGNPGFICREVVIEVAWVLERSYSFTRTRIAEAVMELTASDSLIVENSDDVAAACPSLSAGRRWFLRLDDPYSGRTDGSNAPSHL